MDKRECCIFVKQLTISINQDFNSQEKRLQIDDGKVEYIKLHIIKFTRLW